MSLVLAPDDLASGMFVAVHSRRQRFMVHQTEDRSLLTAIPAETGPPVPCGVPLRVIGLSLPFAACAVLHPGGAESGPAIIDLRDVQLCRLDGSFIASIAAFATDDDEEVDEEDDQVRVEQCL